MADSAVAVTAGTGTNMDTRTEGTNGNHRQVVVLGDPATNAGVAPVDATAGLKVDLGADNDVTVTGTVTANLAAGTNNIGDIDVLTVGGQTPAFGTGARSAATQRVTIATDDVVPAAQSGTWNIATVSAVTAISNALPAGTNAIGKLAANSGVDIGDVDVTSCALPTGASTLAEQQTQTTALQLLDDTVFADDAAVTLGTSKGHLIEGVAVQTDGTDPAAVSAEGDAAALRTDMNRILLVNQTHPRGTTVSADYASAQTNVSVIAAPGASLSIYITDIMLSNGATAGNVTLLDGSGGTVKWEAYPAVNGGAVLSGLRQPIKLTANTALCLTSTTVTTHSIFIGYYIAA